MFSATQSVLASANGGLSGWALRKALIENRRNAWRLTNYKLGGRLGVPPLFALDRAGNILCYWSFNKSSLFGWSLSEADPENFSLSYPMHWKAALLREQAMKPKIVEKRGDPRTTANSSISGEKSRETLAAAAFEKRVLKGKMDPQLADELKEVGADVKRKHDLISTRMSSLSQEEISALVAEAQKDPSAAEVRSVNTTVVEEGVVLPLNSRKLRVNFIATFVFKSFYYSLVCLTAGFFFLQYLLFRQWLNYPARQGLRDLEDRLVLDPVFQVFDDYVAEPWFSSSLIPETIKVSVEDALEFVFNLGVRAAQSFGYNPHHDQEQEDRLVQVEKAQAETRKESLEWKSWAKYGVVACLTIACLL